MSLDYDKLEKEIALFGGEIFQEIKDTSPSFLNLEYYTEKPIEWAMGDEEFKISLFRFVDVLPSLSDASEIMKHVQEYFVPVAHRIPSMLQPALRMAPNSIPAKIAAQLVKRQIRTMAERFILGETPRGALKALRKIRAEGRAFTVDLLGEATLSETESEIYVERYLELLSTLQTETVKWPESKPVIENHSGEISPINISVKLSALYSQVRATNKARSMQVLSERLGTILAKAKEMNAFVYVDMEDSKLVDITLEIARNVFCSEEFRDYPQCGLILQTYLRRTEDDFEEILRWVKDRGTPIALRLVKGAYWDTETILAKQHSRPIPVWQEKAASDLSYERLTIRLLENSQYLLPAFASHNIRSLCHAVKAAELLNVPLTEFELQTLYGMADPIKKAFAERGFLVREYAPIGELIPGMGYLVRRLLENTSNEGFLRLGFHDHEVPELLLAKPNALASYTGVEHINNDYRKQFTNTPLRSFASAEDRANFQQIVDALRSETAAAPRAVKPIVNGEEKDGFYPIDSVSPENEELILAKVERADLELAEEAVKTLHDYFPVWRDTPAGDRIELLFRTADLFEENRETLAACIILEAGKSWLEADAEVAEAIDFLRYYAHQAFRMAPTRKTGDYPGEENVYFYEPRGVALVLNPWSFPCAVPCGMFSAALVTGNCPIFKPASQTPLVAALMFELFLEAGMPSSAAAFLPAPGEVVGTHLVTHPLISTIAFTGSKDVGLQIVRNASLVANGQEHIKRTIIEMGGKNAIIVDSDADLDEAVKGVICSAFGYQGQKCSACSRVIVLKNVYDKFVERLKEATKSIIVGPATESQTFVGPVIDRNSQERLSAVIEESQRDCNLLVQGSEPSANGSRGSYVRPTIFTDIPPGHRLLQEELFGPVLAVVKADNFNAAVEMAMDSDYGLAGAVFSRSPKNIHLAAEKFRVGNLYLNRGSTGALVMRQPFGGARMSGGGSKVGGPDYLLQFVNPRTISENTMRRGFAPMG